MNEFILPPPPASFVSVSNGLAGTWREVVWTVREAGERFHKAYKATIDELIPDWNSRWDTDPYFADQLGQVEEYIRAICLANGMPRSTFGRYRTAARKTVFFQVPFRLGNNFSIAELRAIEHGGPEMLRLIRDRRLRRRVETYLEKRATVLPLPVQGDKTEEYLELVKPRLTEHLQAMLDTLGLQACQKLVEGLEEYQSALDDEIGARLQANRARESASS